MNQVDSDHAPRPPVPGQTCGVCGQPIDIFSANSVLVRGDMPEQWVHEGRCYAELERRYYKPPKTTRERVLELFERARAAGRLQERGRG